MYSNVKDVGGQQPRDDNNNRAATLDKGHVPNTMLGGSLVSFYSILIINVTVFLYLLLDN